MRLRGIRFLLASCYDVVATRPRSEGRTAAKHISRYLKTSSEASRRCEFSNACLGVRAGSHRSRSSGKDAYLAAPVMWPGSFLMCRFWTDFWSSVIDVAATIAILGVPYHVVSNRRRVPAGRIPSAGIEDIMISAPSAIRSSVLCISGYCSPARPRRHQSPD
jgi:hypothetical protein